MNRTRLLRILLLLLTFSCHAYAQRVEHQFGALKNEFTVWNANSFATGHVFGFAQHRGLYATAFRYGRTILTRHHLTLKYTIEAVPAAVLSEPYLDGQPVIGPIAKGSPHQLIYGGGFNPVGLQLNFRRGKRLQPFGTFNGGFLYFSRKVISPQASQFNFTVAGGAGVEFFVSANRAFQVGYRYHHLSNANITDRNPGTDSQMIFFGFSIFH